MTMTQEHLEQVKQLIANIDEQKKQVPYLNDLLSHPIYSGFFESIDQEDKEKIEDLINSYIENKISGLKTKGGVLFKRFFENNTEKFREFRRLNQSEKNTQHKEFQTLGKFIEEEMFGLENILTSNMLRKPQGLNKTVSAFYDVVYSFFPLYNQID